MSANNAVVVILPGVVVAVGALVVFLVDLFVARKAVLAWIAAAGLIAGAAVAVGQWISVSHGLHFNAREPQTGFAGMVALDKYALFCVVLFTGIGVAPQVPGEHVGGQRHELERDEEGDDVGAHD